MVVTLPAMRLLILRALVLLAAAGLASMLARPVTAYPILGDYRGATIQNCADPSVARTPGPDGVMHWYMFCTSDPLHDADRREDGRYTFHLIPILHSTDLVTWDYVGDVFSSRPAWIGRGGLWAPEVQFFDGTWYLYYAAARLRPGGESVIGVATSPSPAGPWTDSGGPVVETHGERWVLDPFVIQDEETKERYIFYGSFVGGIFARKLSSDGLSSDVASETAIAIDHRYESAFIRRAGGYYYLFVSATNCCNQQLTGYSVFAGRSAGLLGPYLDREGVSLLESRVGGTPVISMNGNRWVGPGNGMVITDFAGQDWFVYHAVDAADPHFAGAPGLTKRMALLDPLDWVEEWPTVRGGLWASAHNPNTDPEAPRPAAQPGQRTGYRFQAATADAPDRLIAALSDEFDGSRSAGWTWVREPPAGTADLTGNGSLGFRTQDADLWKDRDDASVLVQGAPRGDYLVETRVHLPVPPDGLTYNHVQAGLVIYGGDDAYVKLVHVAIDGTRQTEFAKEMPAGPRYGNTVVGPPADWTYLRIVKRTAGTEDSYTAYTSRDGTSWVRGGTWTDRLGRDTRIGIVSMGGTGFRASFDYVRVYTLKPSLGRIH